MAAVNIVTRAHVLAIGELETAAHTALIDALIPVVSAQIAAYLDRDLLKAANIVESFEPRADVNRYFLRAPPVTAINTISLGSDVITNTLNDTWILVGEREVRFHRPRSSDIDLLTIDYDGGLEASDADFLTNQPVIATAAAYQIMELIQRKDRLGATSSAVGGTSLTLQGPVKLLPLVREMLDPYNLTALV